MRGARSSCLVALMLFASFAAAQSSDLSAAINAYSEGQYEGAVALLLPMADAGDPVAQFYLGYMYEVGKGVEADLATAVDWYRRSAEQGLLKAQFNLGLAYLEGRGVEPDDAQALEWLLESANQGHLRSQYKVAEMYESARGTRRDFVQAHLWFNLAGKEHYEDARRRKKKVAKQMDPYEIAEAEMLARQWTTAQKD